MFGAGLQFGTIRGEDRFYTPVKARRNCQNQNQQRQGRRGKMDDADSSSSLKDASIAPSSNLDRFLESTTPSVSAQYFSRTTMRGFRTCNVEFQHYFALSDLWESFGEWSAYGAGVPVVLEGCNPVVQYYVPYLSGIQLYGESSATSSSVKSRQVGEDSDGDYYRDSCSDGSSDYEIEKRRLSTQDQHGALQEGFSSDDGEAQNSRGVLLYEYLERDTPYGRKPLADKIAFLASQYPGLKTLRSCDLLAASWLSVAWYPICRIPNGPTLKDLEACFLTYHSLSTPMSGVGNTQAPNLIFPKEIDGIPKFSLTAIGMAFYKFNSSTWIQSGINESRLAHSRMQAADNWLRSLQVKHPDFQFFESHGKFSR